jgi:hypothetical protein
MSSPASAFNALLGTLICGISMGSSLMVQAQQPKHVYPPEIVSGFVTQCAAQAANLDPALMRSLCTCTMDEFQNRYSFAEFRSIGMGMEKGQPMPPEFSDIMNSCASKIIKPQS